MRLIALQTTQKCKTRSGNLRPQLQKLCSLNREEKNWNKIERNFVICVTIKRSNMNIKRSNMNIKWSNMNIKWSNAQEEETEKKKYEEIKDNFPQN